MSTVWLVGGAVRPASGSESRPLRSSPPACWAGAPRGDRRAWRPDRLGRGPEWPVQAYLRTRKGRKGGPPKERLCHGAQQRVEQGAAGEAILHGLKLIVITKATWSPGRPNGLGRLFSRGRSYPRHCGANSRLSLSGHEHSASPAGGASPAWCMVATTVASPVDAPHWPQRTPSQLAARALSRGTHPDTNNTLCHHNVAAARRA